MYRQIVQSLLFRFDPETAHTIAMKYITGLDKFPGGPALLRGISRTAGIPENKITLAGLHFNNRIGLAAGFDKNGQYIMPLSQMGFSHIEVGTVTPLPQPGNERPRLFRLKSDHALINRMGFNNDGADQLYKKLAALPEIRPVIGANIGKNKDTPNGEAWRDYLTCMKKLHPVADYFAVNVSSPNTPGLRALQEKEPLMHILQSLQEYNHGQKNVRPVFLKVSPDNDDAVYEEIAEVIIKCGLDGMIATNTTVSRQGLRSGQEELIHAGRGGLSGEPLFSRALQVVKLLRTHLPQNKILIGVGGITDHLTYHQMRSAGADMVQIYTAFIYKGPAIVADILREK